MRTWIPALVFVTMCVGPWTFAQAQPDVTGTWSAAADAPPGVVAAPSPVFGPRFALRLDGETLTVTRPAARDEIVAATFKLDGSPTRTRRPGGLCQGDGVIVETAAWEDRALVITVVGSVPAGGGTETKQNVRRLLRLEGPDMLVVQASMTQAGQTRPVATVYRRSDPMPAPTARGTVKTAPATIAQAAWISGLWIGATKTVAVEERWTPSASGAMLGLGRTLRNTAMASFEFLCIAERDGSLVYTAMPNGRTPPTDFMLTIITPDEATFENPAHDFPKMIRYSRRPDGTLETVVSGDPKQPKQSFVLTRQD